MDERRFRTALDTISETISDYGEDTIVAAMRTILERFDYEVVKRDPGPDEDVESGNVWPRESDEDLVVRSFGLPSHHSDAIRKGYSRGRVIDLTGRWV